jgi:NAD(P)-dependent dehydrogenase (short-subunit alcohol dehydrogenase family)
MGELAPLNESLLGRVALVTGGAVRVGRVICLALAGRGAHVAFTYLPGEREEVEDPRNGAVVALELAGRSTGGDAADPPGVLAISMDVRQPGAPERTVQQVIDRFGRVDILVNSASVWLRAPFIEISHEDWQTSLDVNLTGPFLMSQAVAPHMLRQRSGLIINITDLSAYQTWPGSAHHAASKAGLVALTRVMAAELAPHVRVNAIAPGTVLLPAGANEAKVEWAVQNSLLKRVGQPEDVARTVLFLVDSDFATGAVYFMDGGRALV